MSDENEHLYAFYSITQELSGRYMEYKDNNGRSKRNVRYNIYLLENGEEAIVTEVNSDPNYISRFNDVIKLGKVTKWLQTVYW